jgi:creatine kinase
MAKPLDASDVTDLDAAKSEVALLRFRMWDAMQAAASPADPKDGDDFKYVSYTEMPPWTPLHKSLMAKVLQEKPELWDALKDKKTSKGYTLSNCIQTGVQTPHLGVGITAGDEESWTVFKDIMYPVIKGWHGFDPEVDNHKSDLDASHVGFSDEQSAKFDEYVVSTRIRAARNVSGFSLPAGATDEERKGVETVLRGAFEGLSGDLKGKYYPLYEMSSDEENFLQENGFLFQKPKVTNLLTNAGAARNWPQGRGIFHNDARTALCWCNEEDHCRIISMENGGNVKSVFARFSALSAALKTSAEANGTKLMFSDKLGFLGTCPSNLGTGLRASVMIKLPKFNEDPALLEKVCDKFDLQPRGSAGEHSAAVGAKWDISNKQRIGFTEVELVQKMIDGVTKIIALEEKMAAGQSIAEGTDF